MSSRPRTDGDPLWYKDAIIYEVNLKGFRDSNRDGIGDFAGLTEKLDYIQDLGVTCIWILPLDRNDGFSEADAALLFAPLLAHALGGWPAVTVEAQQRNSSSLLHWMRKLISLRRRNQAFSRGSFQMLEPDNQKVLAYVRQYRYESILVVSNLSRLAQPVSLDLTAWRGRVPLEMFGRTPLPPIGDALYFLTLAPHGFYWLNLEEAHALDESWRALELRVTSADRPPALSLATAAAQSLAGLSLRKIEAALVRPYLEKQAWFAGGGRALHDAALRTLQLDKAVREVTFELDHRPSWVHIPLRGLVRLLKGRPS